MIVCMILVRLRKEKILGDFGEIISRNYLSINSRGRILIETRPNGLLYVLTFDQESDGEGKIYRILSYDNTVDIHIRGHNKHQRKI
jgi:hypothetical protein